MAWCLLSASSWVLGNVTSLGAAVLSLGGGVGVDLGGGAWLAGQWKRVQRRRARASDRCGENPGSPQPPPPSTVTRLRCLSAATLPFTPFSVPPFLPPSSFLSFFFFFFPPSSFLSKFLEEEQLKKKKRYRKMMFMPKLDSHKSVCLQH